jgi:hypothetical protein
MMFGTEDRGDIRENKKQGENRTERKKERKKFIINKLLPNYNTSSKNRRSKVNSLSLVWFDDKGSETRLSAQPGLFTIFVTGVDKI